jgi:hypothetical protein
MKCKIALISCFLFVILACSKKEESTDAYEKLEYKKQFINPLHFRDEFEKELSFPIWFSSELIRKNKIKKIIRRIYPQDLENNYDLKQLKTILPIQKREYYFNSNGFLDRIVLISYYDDRVISREAYQYEGNMSADGYRMCKLTHKTNHVENEELFSLESEPTNQQSLIQNRIASNYKFNAYSIENNSTLFTVKKSNYWGPLSIDSIVKPASKDWIIHGKYKKPHKRYSVQNKVIESNVHSYLYSKNGLLISRNYTEYPFDRKRTFLYSSDSNWKGFVDSTFSEDQFISSKHFEWHRNEQNLPTSLIQRKGADVVEDFIYIETYEYIF